MAGHLPVGEHDGHGQELSWPEEIGLERYIDTLQESNLAVTKALVRDAANSILKAKASKSTPPSTVGPNWVDGFIRRHYYHIVGGNKILDAGRQNSEPVRSTVTRWYDMLRVVMEAENLLPEDIWSMDETVFQIGVGKSQMVVARPRPGHLFGVGIPEANRERATAIEAISAGGQVIPAFLVLRGKYHYGEWYMIPELEDETCLALSDIGTGCSNDQVAMWWIKHFEKYSRRDNMRGKRLLLVDAHGSHYTVDFIRFCQNHNIIPFALPLYHSHLLQPFDAGVFQSLKLYHSKALDKLSRDGCLEVTKIEFLTFIQDIRRQAFKKETILSAFKKTGIAPYNPQIVLERIPPLRQQPHTAPSPPAPSPPSTPSPVSTPSPPSSPSNPRPSSPFTIPFTFRQLSKSANELTSFLTTSDIPPVMKRKFGDFIEGSLIQGAELVQVKHYVIGKSAADEGRK